MTLPNFIGIGTPKSGTTWIFQCLKEHPEVFVAACKETKFFDEGAIEGRFQEYERHFKGADGAIAIGEISTRYLSSTKAPERIHRILPNVRLFVSLRNPVEQVYSHYWHLRRQNFHQGQIKNLPQSFEEALSRFEQKLLFPALYSQHLNRWFTLFDRRKIHVVLYEDISKHPIEVLTGLYEFLGVRSDIRPPSAKRKDSSVRAGVSPRNAFLEHLHSHLYQRLVQNVYFPLYRHVGPQWAERVREMTRIRPLMEGLFFRKGYPPMRPETRKLLRKRFQGEIGSLEKLLCRDLRHWK